MSTPRAHGRAGMKELQQAVRMALADGECLGPAEVSRRTGIYQGAEWHDMIARGVLLSLRDRGEVEQCDQANGRRGWRLTDA